MIASFRGFLTAHWQLLLLVGAVFLLWRQPIAMPLRILVVLFHEAAHALAAILTGGRVDGLTIDVNEGGHALVAGGNFFVIASSGYLGSLAIGLTLLAISLRSNVDRLALGVLGVAILLLASPLRSRLVRVCLLRRSRCCLSRHCPIRTRNLVGPRASGHWADKSVLRTV